MKIFYDKDGNVTGFVEGATPEIEANIKMKGQKEVTLPDDVAALVMEPGEPLSATDITIDQQSK